MDTTEQTAILESCRAKVKASRELQAQQQFVPAIDALKEALASAATIETPTEPLLELQAAANADLAMVYQRLGDVRSSNAAYAAGEAVARTLPADEPTGKYRLLLATMLVNVSSLYLRERMLDHGLMKLDEAVTLIESVPTASQPAARTLLLGALHNRATIELAARKVAEARISLERALELGSELMQGGASHLNPQVIDIAGRLATVYRMAQELEEALKVAERGARWAEAAYEGGSAMGLRLYVATQLQLVDIKFGLGRFAAAEDHLWKAIDTAGDGQVLVVAANFYLALLRNDDDKLAAGDLPGDEITEALDEVLGRLETKNAPEWLRDLLRARQTLMVQHEVDDPREVLRGLEMSNLSGDPMVPQMIPLLRADLEWVEKLHRAQ